MKDYSIKTKYERAILYRRAMCVYWMVVMGCSAMDCCYWLNLVYLFSLCVFFSLLSFYLCVCACSSSLCVWVRLTSMVTITKTGYWLTVITSATGSCMFHVCVVKLLLECYHIDCSKYIFLDLHTGIWHRVAAFDMVFVFIFHTTRSKDDIIKLMEDISFILMLHILVIFMTFPFHRLNYITYTYFKQWRRSTMIS